MKLLAWLGLMLTLFKESWILTQIQRFIHISSFIVFVNNGCIQKVRLAANAVKKERIQIDETDMERYFIIFSIVYYLPHRNSSINRNIYRLSTSLEVAVNWIIKREASRILLNRAKEVRNIILSNEISLLL